MLLDSIKRGNPYRRGGGVSVQVRHVKASGRENWPKIDRRPLRLLDTARARGVDVSGDVYPYNAGSTKLDNMMPTWAHDGGTGPQLLERLARPCDAAAHRRGVPDRPASAGARSRRGGSIRPGLHRHLPPARAGRP